MNTEPRSSAKVAILLLGVLAIFTVAAGQTPSPETRQRRGTVQSELDYLRAAKLPISIELSQVTIRQAFDGIAHKGAFVVAYEGTVNADSKHDVSFKNVALKDVLSKLGETMDLSYRVDGPDKLTVIATSPKSS
jgi:hypothetical protein